MVFERPNNGRRSKNMIPLSSGRAKRTPNIFFATIGVPLANVNSANNCSMCKKCILAGYLSPLRCATPHRHLVIRRSLPGGACTRWKAPPLPGEHPKQTFDARRGEPPVIR
jgi:hypothetical protein